MVSTSNITKHFGPARAVNDVTIDVPKGALAAIIGKSGSGKSTLLSLLGGLEKPSSGTIVIAEKATTSLTEHALTAFRRNHIGFVFQSFNLIANVSALDNVMLPMEFAHIGLRARRARAIGLLDQVGISGAKQHRLPAKLSGGEQQRVAIARALANKPSLILADEPTGNLDSENGEKIFSILRELGHEHGVTVILVTHDDALAKRCDMIMRLRDGEIV